MQHNLLIQVEDVKELFYVEETEFDSNIQDRSHNQGLSCKFTIWAWNLLTLTREHLFFIGISLFLCTFLELYKIVTVCKKYF